MHRRDALKGKSQFQHMPPESHLLEQLIKGLNLTRKRLYAFKKHKDSPLVVMREGQIGHIPASKLPDLD